MATRCLLALDYADHHAKSVLKKIAKKRSLGELKASRRYTPPQPVLSLRPFEVDISGTRTYRPKSSVDIIEEQHRLLHNIYTKNRSVSSAPAQSKRTAQVKRSSQAISPDVALDDAAKSGQRTSSAASHAHNRRKMQMLRRPKTTGNLTKVPAATETHLNLEEEMANLIESQFSHEEFRDQIRDQRDVEKCDISGGWFVVALRLNSGHTATPEYLPIGSEQEIDEDEDEDDHDDATNISTCMINAEGAQSPQNAVFYRTDATIGTKVANEIKAGNNVRIGVNGIIRSYDLHFHKENDDETESLASGHTEPSRDDSALPPVPLCWNDQLSWPQAKVLGPSEFQPEKQREKNNCETHPVIFTRAHLSRSARPRLACESKSHSKAKQSRLLQTRARSAGVPTTIRKISVHAHVTEAIKLEINTMGQQDAHAECGYNGTVRNASPDIHSQFSESVDMNKNITNTHDNNLNLPHTSVLKKPSPPIVTLSSAPDPQLNLILSGDKTVTKSTGVIGRSESKKDVAFRKPGMKPMQRSGPFGMLAGSSAFPLQKDIEYISISRRLQTPDSDFSAMNFINRTTVNLPFKAERNINLRMQSAMRKYQDVGDPSMQNRLQPSKIKTTKPIANTKTQALDRNQNNIRIIEPESFHISTTVPSQEVVDQMIDCPSEESTVRVNTPVTPVRACTPTELITDELDPGLSINIPTGVTDDAVLHNGHTFEEVNTEQIEKELYSTDLNSNGSSDENSPSKEELKRDEHVSHIVALFEDAPLVIGNSASVDEN